MKGDWGDLSIRNAAAYRPAKTVDYGGAGRDMPGRSEENALMAASLAALGHPRVRCFHLKGCDHGGTLDHCEPSIAAFLKELGENRK